MSKPTTTSIPGVDAQSPDGTPRTIIASIRSTRRGTLLLTSFADRPVPLAHNELIVWSLGDGRRFLTLGREVPDWKLRELAADEGIDPQELIRLRDEVVEVAA